MKQISVSPQAALDRIVLGMVQRFENIHFRTEATIHLDENTGDEFVTIHDPVTDCCLTVWLSPAWYGDDVLKLAKSVLESKIKR